MAKDQRYCLLDDPSMGQTVDVQVVLPFMFPGKWN